jgi:hypothetical protein
LKLMKQHRLPGLAIISARSLFFALVASPSGLFAQPAPDAAVLKALLERMKANAMRYEGHLPDFTCTEVTVRKEDSSGSGANWRTVDTLEEIVSFASSGRVSKKLVKRNGRPTTRNGPGGLTENAVLSGAIVPQGIFGPKSQPKFDWDHWETRSGRRIAVFAYQAVGVNYPDGKTRYELTVSGRVFFDDTAGNLVRTESSSVGPPGYPFGEVRVEMDYTPVTLSDRDLILPTRAVMMTVRGKRRYQSEMEFSAYRKFEAVSTIRFNDAH